MNNQPLSLFRPEKNFCGFAAPHTHIVESRGRSRIERSNYYANDHLFVYHTKKMDPYAGIHYITQLVRLRRYAVLVFVTLIQLFVLVC